VAIALLFGGAAFVFGLRWLESAMTFHPVRLTADQRISPPNSASDVWFSAKDGTRLHGWYFPSQQNDRSVTIIYFHGNGGNLSNVGWLGERLAQRGFSVLLFDYRGYGLSGGETVDEADLYLDGEAAWDFVVNEKKAAPETVVLYGPSLGNSDRDGNSDAASHRGADTRVGI
jgi:cephalosporin-C deacetylase-like acetyl esterase